MSDSAPQRSMPRAAIIAIVLVVLLAAGGLGYWMLSGSDPDTESTAAPSATAQPTASASSEASPTASPLPSVEPGSFVYAEGDQFMLDGEPFYYASSNAYTLMLESEPGVQLYMKSFAESHMPVVRTWAFYDVGTEDGEMNVEGNNRNIYFQYWDPAAGAPAYNESENGIQRLDYVLYAAREHGLKLMLPLVNNWTAFGGADQYVRWAGLEYHDDFFTDETIKGWYKDWVSYLLNRVNPLTGIAYKDDPTVMMWEIGNEMRCSDTGPFPVREECNSDMIAAWASEMAAHIKSIDSNHLVGFGGEGFLCTEPDSDDTLFNCEESADPVVLLEDPNIDAHGIHVYPNHWLPTNPTDDWEEWGAWWIEEQGAIAQAANKPYYIGEHGWIDLKERLLVFDHWLQVFYDAGGDGSHFWIMQPADSIAAPTDGVGFTQKCPGPACDLVGDWSQHVGQGVPWDDFGPIAESDFGSSAGGEAVSLAILANDKVFEPATWDVATIDLDPATAGVQTEFVDDKGTFTVEADAVVFTPAADSSGTARASYVVADSEGRLTLETRITVTQED